MLHCQSHHHKNCMECSHLVGCAKDVLNKGIVELATLFKTNFPGIVYSSKKAVRRLMQLPIAIVMLQLKGPGSQKLYVTELNPNVDYCVFAEWMVKLKIGVNTEKYLSKDVLQGICSLASTEKDRKLIKYVACQSNGFSNKKASQEYSVYNFSCIKKQVENALKDAVEIRQTVMELAEIKEKATLESFGIYVGEESDNSSDDEVLEYSCDMVDNACREETSEVIGGNCDEVNGQKHLTVPDSSVETNVVNEVPTHDCLLSILRENNLNWFSFVVELEQLLQNCTTDVLEHTLLEFSEFITSSDLTDYQKGIVEQSRKAFLQRQQEDKVDDHDQIQTDSESDDPEAWVGVQDVKSSRGQALIKKHRTIIQRKAKREINKEIAARQVLRRKNSKKVSRILAKYPNIGRDIEEYVQSKRVGADQWRRTGVLTFDGNETKTGPKVTYRRIKKHLENKYKSKFGYGTVVQLCVARNKRRISAGRYKGVAKVTSRRARKGFTLKLNPDAHYSNSMYKALDLIELSNGTDKMVLNRDDQAGFRLDTTYTHKQHKAISLRETPELTTRTDYVNKYTSVLQTTSYLFMNATNTAEKCVGVVKPHHLFEKTPMQHFCDFQMLKEKDELKAWMKDKTVHCVRVDGAGDEGPVHKEVQFRWTMLHISEATECTVVTTRHSGGSYLNRVELQNGCLAVAQSNLFIPSTLCGSNFNDQGLDKAKLAKNLDAATEVFIDRVSGAPCGESEITLFKGPNDELSKAYNDSRPDLLVFLNGKEAAKKHLRDTKPDVYKNFQSIWTVRNNHMVKNLPTQYAFMLIPCFKKDCIHPVCKRGQQEQKLWYEGGRPLSLFPIPIPDPKQTWGGECSKCKKTCSGHFLPPQECIAYIASKGTNNCMFNPPSEIIKNEFNKLLKLNAKVTDAKITEPARQTLLPVDDVKFWIEHLQGVHERRKNGALKAANTRAERKKKEKNTESTCSSKLSTEVPKPQSKGSPSDVTQDNDIFCICKQEEFGDMIACDNEQCPIGWFHFPCVGIEREPPGQWYCEDCQAPGTEVICVCRQVEYGLVLKCSNNDCKISEYHAQCVGVQIPSVPWLCDDCLDNGQ